MSIHNFRPRTIAIDFYYIPPDISVSMEKMVQGHQSKIPQ